MFKIYQIMPGDNLEIIADKTGTTVDYLMEINDFSNVAELYPGMSIIVPNMNGNGNFTWYSVEKGDSIYSIAKKYHVNYKDILALNGLDEKDYIYPNQMIMIPNDNINYYITQNGDTLDLVSSRMNSDIDDIVRQNSTIYLIPDQFLIYKKEEKF